jgi:hypothetical protein
MIQFIAGILLGWFAHLHYGEQVTAAITRIIGGE